MMSSNHHMLVLFKSRYFSEEAIEQEMECISGILLAAAIHDQFFIANELVDRNRISSNPKKIARESRYYRLRSFRFLLNKN
ncbi:MAG: hypothetical protein ABIR30_11055 [Chitinophagaceae bacterium]